MSSPSFLPNTQSPKMGMTLDEFAGADLNSIFRMLTISEKVSLLSAPVSAGNVQLIRPYWRLTKLLMKQNWWNTTKIDRVGVPTIKMSDGPVSTKRSFDLKRASPVLTCRFP